MINRQHPFFPTFLELMRTAAASTPVYDLGTNARFVKEIGLVRELFDERKYFAGGFNPDTSLGSDACDFHCDVQDLSGIADGTAGCVLSMEVLEHVEDPAKATCEFHRILRPGGIAIISVPFMTSYHGKRLRQANPAFDAGAVALARDNAHSTYGDYWRFTHEGLTRVLAGAGFRRVEIWPVDGSLICRLELLRAYESLSRWSFFRRLIARYDKPALGRATTRHFAKALK